MSLSSEPPKLDTSRQEGLAASKYSVVEGIKDLAMRNQRDFSLQFKRQVVEEMVGGRHTRIVAGWPEAIVLAAQPVHNQPLNLVGSCQRIEW